MEAVILRLIFVSVKLDGQVSHVIYRGVPERVTVSEEVSVIQITRHQGVKIVTKIGWDRTVILLV